MAASALDLPTGAQVTAGAASVQMPAKGSLLVNQSTQRAVIKWNDFSIGQGKQVTFAQPNAGAATLNIVNGTSASSIAGTLKSNGSVYLINQNGIAITPTGLVDTRAGFIASTLRMDENAFMNGKYLFSGKGGSVVNRGQILTGPGGTVGLLGSTVANEGLISAPLGKVALGSGEAATLDLSGDGFLQVMLPTSAVGADGQALVTNSGVIQADGGMVMLKAATVRQALREAVNMPGTISARSVSGQNGAIVLEGGAGGTVRVSGAMSADGDTTGGRIDVAGANVTLEGASLSATGTVRGGLVRLGGAFQGGREQAADSENATLFAGRFGSAPAITNATTTSIDAASSINVSATGPAGTGGTAIVWSDNTTVMQGAIAARGAVSGGAVEVSAKSTVQSVDLKRIDLGKGGNLLIDPQDIVIDHVAPADAAASYNYATPGSITHLLDTDLTALLSTGATVSLQASQDINWLNNFTFVTRTSTTPGGNLNLSAGRSVTLSGIFTTADGNWTIVANDTAANGVVNAERGAGAAAIDVRNANFINSNGNLSLTLADGEGNTHKEVDRISLGKFNGNGLTAAISPTATPAYGTTQILLTDDINVYDTLSLTGNLQVSSMNSVLSLSGQHVTWTDEKTGSTIRGEQNIKFIENGVATRFGQLSGSDAVRLGLGDSPVLGLTRIYGDSDPDIANVLALTSPLHVAAHSATTEAPDPLGAILSVNSLDVVGPGVLASAGSNNLTLSATNNLAFVSGLSSGYFIDLAQATIPLTINKRTVTPTVSAGAYIYGSPTAVTSLAGAVNGDVLQPVATLNGTVGVHMANNSSGFGFAETVSAGSSNFSLTGLYGSKASNYTLDLSGVTGSTLAITPKALNYVAGSGGQTYGSLGTLPSASLSGIVAGDDVEPVVALNAAGQAVSLTDRLPAGTYVSDVSSLTGSKAGNYSVAANGNTLGHYVVDPKPVSVTYNSSPVVSTYGTQTTLEAPALTGVLSGDTVTGSFGAADSWSGAPVALTPTTPAGYYSQVVTGLSGASGSNYVLAGGNNYGSLSIAKKTLTYSNSNSSQVYGQLTLPSPTLNGIVGTDSVSGVQRITTYPLSFNLAGESGAYPVGNYGVDLVALTGASSANYTLAESGNSPNQVSVTAKAVTFSLASANSIYGTNAVLPTVNLSGIVSGDVVAAGPVVAIGYGAAALNANTAAGNYTLGIQGLTGNGVANNYRLASSGNTTGALTIAPKTLTWAVANDTAIYGNALTNATTLNGLVGGDSVASSITAFDANGAALTRPTIGNYGVGVTSLTGPLASNYALVTSGNTMGSVIVGPRPLNYTIAQTNSVYGTLAQDGAVLLSNVLPGDNVGAATLGYQVASTPVTLTERSPVGSYASQVTALTGGNPNYVIASTGNTNGVLTIAPKPVTFSTPNASSTYGTAAVLEAGTLSGVLAGDVVQPGATTLATGLLPLERQAAGSYALITPSLSGPQAGNYTIAATGSTNGKLGVAPKPLTYSLEVYLWGKILPGSVTYGLESVTNGAIERGTRADPGFENRKYSNGYLSSGVATTLSGVLAGDVVDLHVNSPTLPVSTSNYYTVGTYRWTGGALSSPNYIVAATGNADKTVTILPKPLPVKTLGNANDVWSQNSVVYGSTAGAVPGVFIDWNDIAHYTIGVQDQVSAAAEYVTPQGNVARLAERQAVGEYQVVMKGGLTGADAGNYIATPSFYQQKFSVTPKTVTVQFFDVTKTYGEQAEMPSPVLSGVLPGDSLGATISINGNANFVLDPRAPVGLYAIDLVGKTGADAGNYFIKGIQTDFAKYYWPHSEILARLKILPKKLTVVGGIQNFALTYGDIITVNHMSIDGVLPGDNVQITPKAVPWDRAQPQQDINGVRLNAGTYTIGAALSGDASSNYTFATYGLGFGRIDVSKRITTFPDVNVTYGDRIQDAFNFIKLNNVLAGDSIDYSSYDINAGSAYNLDVGKYSINIGPLRGSSVNNYTLALKAPVLTISPKVLSWTPNSNTTVTYGDGIQMGVLSGFVGDDVLALDRNTAAASKISPIQLNAAVKTSDVNVPQFKISGATNEVVPSGLSPDAGSYMAVTKVETSGVSLSIYYSGFNRLERDYYLSHTNNDVLINAGSPTLFAQGTATLTGNKSGNYVLPINMETTLQVKQRPVTYSVQNIVRQYGNFAGCDGSFNSCQSNVPATTFGNITYMNVLPSDDLTHRGRIDGGEQRSLIAADGSRLTDIPVNTPVNSVFFQVIDSINSKNYVLANSGSQAGILQVIPKWLTYTTSSAFYMPGVGLVGSPGIATLSGIINGEEVSAVVIPKNPNGSVATDFKNLIEGRYSFPVTALTGKDSANYAILENLSYQKYGGWGTYNDIGSLDVFADTRLGMGYVPVQPFPAPILEPLPRANIKVLISSSDMSGVTSNPSAGDQLNTGLSMGGGQVSVQPVAQLAVEVAGASATAVADASATAVTGVKVGVGTSIGTETDVGGVTIGAEANTNTSAGCNVLGCKAIADAHAETFVELSADDKLKLEADAYAKVKAGLSLSGVELSAKTVAQLAVEVAGSHGAGGAGDVNYSVIAAAVAGAQAKGVASWDDGLKLAAGTQTGVGVTVGAGGGVSGSVGSISATPSITSPGSFGGQFEFSPGYSDGVLSVSMNLGAQIGLGGLNLNIDVSIDLGAVSDFLNSWKDDRTMYEKSRDYAFSLESDPLQQIAYLEATSDWRHTGQDISKLTNTLDSYHRLMTEMKDAKQHEIDTQNSVLALMKSDPAAALAFIHKEDFFNGALRQKEEVINYDACSLNLHLGVNNGQMILANGKQ